MNGSISEEELKKKLTKEQYHICVEGDTEVPFSGEYVNKKVLSFTLDR